MLSPHDVLQRYFGFAAFRAGQEDALQQLIAGRDTLVVMPTGAGKSLIYQIAALLLPGTTLVFSPLVALMKDQVDSLARCGIAATYINSTLDPAEQNRRLCAFADSAYKIVLVAPERLRSATFRGALKRVELSLFVVDEAHCLSQWGHDFRPDYLHIAEARREFKPPLTLALTATATVRVQDEIVRLLGLTHAEKLVKGFNRPNIFFQVLPAPDAKTKYERVREFLLASEGAGIIYAGTRRDAEEVAEFAREVVHKNAQHYHAGLDRDARNALQDAFLSGDLPLIVATNAFGMGIDRPDVRFVLHHMLPGTLEAYYQEAGRAGRDGLPAQAALIYSPKDTALHETFIENNSPTARDLRAVHDFLRQHPRTDLYAIERATGMPQVKTRVAVDQLERARVLQCEAHDEFGVMRAQTATLSEAILREIASQVSVRRAHKRALLEKMVGYAETNACRRRTILDYFGDHGLAEAPLCCDNDIARACAKQTLTRPAATDAERAALTVLATIASLKWGLGKEKLAMMLTGSRSQKVQAYARSPQFGKLAGWRGADVESLVTQLTSGDYLKQVGSDKPVLRLTPRGEHALKTHAAVQVDVRPPDPTAYQKTLVDRAAGGTIELTAQMHARGFSTERIASERGLTIGTIYSHLALLIAAGRTDVNSVVPDELRRQIRDAIEQTGSAQYLAPIKARLPDEVDYGIIRCVANAWIYERSSSSSDSSIRPPNAEIAQSPDDTLVQSQAAHPQSPTDPITAFLSRVHPRPLQGPWRAGWALDFHSRFDGDAQNRSVIGELVFRYKYRGECALATELASHWARLLDRHGELPKPDAVIPVPPSIAREFDPVMTLARALAVELKISARLGVLVKTRTTMPQKEMTSLAQKQSNVAGAFSLRGDVRGKNIILVDDLYDSGATLNEAARVLARGGTASIVALTLTRTIHADA
ncbi:MAG: RecQ family ATP-dependent DNA helicase [Chloroflexi bacterium]|nr:RecQ family ATP-dependent DNA helicase [Chloroflexota bacterium]